MGTQQITMSYQKTDQGAAAADGNVTYEWEVVHPDGVALRSHPDYNARITSVQGPQVRSKITASGPPVSALGSSAQMVQIQSINGQLYPPVQNGPRYWLPIRTEQGQEVLRPANQKPDVAPPAYGAAPVSTAAWVQATAPDGRPYWYKEGTQETTWENPNGQQTLQQPVHRPANVWNQVTDPTGKPYYHNPVTNETAWQLPAGAMIAASSQPSQPIIAQPQQVYMQAQPVMMQQQQQVYVAQPMQQQNSRAPSRQLREQRLRNARGGGGGMS